MKGPQMTQIFADLGKAEVAQLICENLRNLRTNFLPNEP
jgi:hypothetical protein